MLVRVVLIYQSVCSSSSSPKQRLPSPHLGIVGAFWEVGWGCPARASRWSVCVWLVWLLVNPLICVCLFPIANDSDTATRFARSSTR
jgi:hypothetical protein